MKNISEWLKEDKTKIIELASNLIKQHNEANIEDTRSSFKLIEQYLSQEKINFSTLKKEKMMPNLVSKLETDPSNKTLLFNGHLDFLPVGNLDLWDDSPFSGKVANGKIYGRGAADMKGGVVAMTVAYVYLNRLKNQLKGNVDLMIVSDEETGWGRGSYFVRQKMPELKKVDGVLMAEPTHPETIAFSSKGYTQIHVDVKTAGYIAGYDNIGQNAIEVATDIIHRLRNFPEIKVTLPQAILNAIATDENKKWYEDRVGKGMVDELSKTTLTISKFQAGESPSMIPSVASFEIMMVTPQNVNRQNILARIRRLIKKFPGATMQVIGGDEADLSEPNGKLFSTLQTSVETVTGKRPRAVPEIAISDGRYWRWDNIPTFWYGFNGEKVGDANESIEIDQLFYLIEIYVLTALKYFK